MATVRVPISDAVIRRYAGQAVKQLTDARYPLRFRYGADRKTGSWFVVKTGSGKTVWRKVGNYPDLNTRALLQRFPDIMAAIAANHDAAVVIFGRFEKTQDLLQWYCTRVDAARYIGKKRRGGIASVINRQLLGRVGKLPINGICHDAIDSDLIQPMQAVYSLAYIRQVFDVLQRAFRQAHKLKLIASNPMVGLKFGDFVSAPVRVRDGRVRKNQIPQVVTALDTAAGSGKMLVLMLLLHGTRISETAAARWDDIDWAEREWLIPADNTKTKAAHRLPLSDITIAALKRHRAEQEAAGYTGVYLFPNNRGRNISGSGAGYLVTRISGGHWSSHDLRKLARTCWADLGIDYMVSERLLNHAMTKLDQAYIHTYVEVQKRAAIEKYHAYLRKFGLGDTIL